MDATFGQVHPVCPHTHGKLQVIRDKHLDPVRPAALDKALRQLRA
jgi:uncharacterized protein YbaR (Trm112 family)